MGRPRLSNDVKALRGTSRADRMLKVLPDSSPSEGPPPPRPHLKGEGRQCWIDMTSQYSYTDDLLNLLETGCEQRQLYSQAFAQVEREGLTITNAQGVVRPHPAAATGRDALKEYRTIMAQLGIRGGSEGSNA